MRNDAINGLTSTATTAGTTTLTVNSLPNQRFTGSTTQTIVLPVVTTLSVGWKTEIINDSTGILTVNSSGGNLVTTVAAGDRTTLSCTAIAADTTATPWTITNISKSTGSSSGITLVASVTTTSGTSKDFTGIPSTAKRITVMLNGVSTNGTSALLIQIGSGSILNSGYSSSGGYFGLSESASFSSTGFNLTSTTGTAVTHSGVIIISMIGNNTWVFSAVLGRNDAYVFASGGNSPGLSGPLDRIRLTTANGTDAFDTGSWSISYE